MLNAGGYQGQLHGTGQSVPFLQAERQRSFDLFVAFQRMGFRIVFNGIASIHHILVSQCDMITS